MGTTGQDVRFGLRMLRKSPGFSAVAVFTLALGIGASAIVFSIIYNGVLYPFPYRSADRLTAINIQDLEHADRGHGMYHLDEVAAFRNDNHTFEDILGYGLFPQMVYARRDSSEMLAGVGATPNAMEFWGVPPLIGRGFGEPDVQSGAPPVVLLNYRFWNREFHGERGVLGKTIMLNGKARTIIGVMPPRFQAVGSDVYMPVSWTRPEPVHGRFEWDVDDPLYCWATGILRQGVSFETAAADIDVIARQLAKVHPDDYPKNFQVVMKRLNDVVLGGFKGEDPVGRQIKFNIADQLPETAHDAYFEIVGVVNDSRGYDFEGGGMVPTSPDKTLPAAFLPVFHFRFWRSNYRHSDTGFPGFTRE